MRDNFTFITSTRIFEVGRRGKFFPGPKSTAAAPVVIPTPAVVTMTLDTAFGVTMTLN